MSDLNINNKLTQIPAKGKSTMKEKMKLIILIITFFVFLIIFVLLYPYVLLFMDLKDDKIQIFLSFFHVVFPVISAFVGLVIGYFLGQKESE